MKDGNEDAINAMLPDKLPKNIQKLYDKGHEWFLLSPSNLKWTKSLRDGLPRLWHSDFSFLCKNSGKQVLKVVLLSHHNETIKQDRPSHCLWKEYHYLPFMTSEKFLTRYHFWSGPGFYYYIQDIVYLAKTFEIATGIFATDQKDFSWNSVVKFYFTKSCR